MITLRQLRYLTALARHRHFGRAAADCAVTQPALSMQVRELEREIGAELVERRPGEIALTDTGLDVAQRAEQILTATRDLVDFARHRDVLSGRLRLGIIPTLAPYILPLVLPRLQVKYPQLRLEVRETQTKTLLDELNRGELDAVMLALPADGADVETLALFDDAFLLAVPAADALPARGRVGVAQVHRHELEAAVDEVRVRVAEAGDDAEVAVVEDARLRAAIAADLTLGAHGDDGAAVDRDAPGPRPGGVAGPDASVDDQVDWPFGGPAARGKEAYRGKHQEGPTHHDIRSFHAARLARPGEPR